VDPVNGAVTPLRLLRQHLEQIIEHVQSEAPLEACGLVGGRDGQSALVIPITNVLRSPTRYRMDPQEQLNAFLLLEEQECDLLAIYHSHPQGSPYPSETDRSEAYYPDSLYVILSPGENGWELRSFMINSESSLQVPVDIQSKSSAENRDDLQPDTSGQL